MDEGQVDNFMNYPLNAGRLYNKTFIDVTQDVFGMMEAHADAGSGTAYGVNGDEFPEFYQMIGKIFIVGGPNLRVKN